MKSRLMADMPVRDRAEAASVRAERQAVWAQTGDNRTARVLLQAGEEARRMQCPEKTDAE